MPTHHLFRSILLSIILQLLLTKPLTANPIIIKNTAKDLEFLKKQLDVRRKNDLELQPDKIQISAFKNDIGLKPKRKKRPAVTNSVESQTIPTKRSVAASDFKVLSKTSDRSAAENSLKLIRSKNKKSNVDANDEKTIRSRASSGDGGSENLGHLSSAKDSVVNGISSVVNPIDEVARKAVNGVGLAVGIVNGIASGIGTHAFNSLVRVHNTNVENLTKLKDLTKNVGHAAVDLGSTVIGETVNVLDVVRRENNRLLRKATDNVPVVRHLVSLKDVAGLAATNGLTSVVKGGKRLGNLAVNAVSMSKGEEAEEAKGGLSGVMTGMSGMSKTSADSLINTFGNTKEVGAMLNGLVSDNDPDAAFEIGNFIGTTAGASKLTKIALTSDVKTLFTE